MVKDANKTENAGLVKAKVLKDFRIHQTLYKEGTVAEFTAEQVGRLPELLTTDLETKTLAEIKAMEKALKNKQMGKANTK